MILPYLLAALSLFIAPLALGRPASAPTHKLHPPPAPAEPSALLGRRYLVHDHRDASRPRIYAYTYTMSPSTLATASPRPPQTPRRRQPFAKYFADRSGDVWVHERPRAPAPNLVPRDDADDDSESDEATMKYVNYVSHVGPFAYEPPLPPGSLPPPSTVTVTVSSQPSSSSTLSVYNQSASTSAASMETTMPVMNRAEANATVTSTSTEPDPSPTSVTAESGSGKKARSKRRVKLHKGGKEYKEKKKYYN